jgi:hypothetical protein
MVLVPKILPDLEPPRIEPIVAYMNDLFTRPCPFRGDVILDVSEHWETVMSMMDCHESQFYEWMPWIDGILEAVPQDRTDRRDWLATWYLEKTQARIARFWQSVWGSKPKLLEAYEISEYAGKPSASTLEKLFPGHRYTTENK